jgi:vitamin B12 transporter
MPYAALPLLVVLLLLAAPLFPVLADDSPVTRLPELVVTATAEPAPATDVPVHVQVISREEIERSGATTLTDILVRNHPGVFYSVPGATGVGIRGFRSAGFGGGPDIKNRTLILIDGHRAGIGNIALIPMDNVERIEVVRGPGSVLYGASAIGGVINVIIRKGEGPPKVVAGAEYGSFDHTLFRGGYSASTQDDRFGLAVAGRTFSRDDYNIGGSGPTLENSAYRDNAVSLGMRFDPVPGHRFSAVGSAFSAEAGAPGSITFPSADESTEETHRFGSLAYDGTSPDGGLTWRASAFHAFHEYTFLSPSWDSRSMTETNTRGGRLQVTLPTFDLGRLTVGGEHERIRDRHKQDVFSPDTDYDITALFAEERLTLDRLTLYFGGRYDWYCEETLETAGLDVSPDRETFQHASWRGGAVYEAAEWLSLRAAVGTGFRPPVAEELTGEYVSWGTTYRGNPDLEAETSITSEAGLDLFWRRSRAGVTLFHTRSRDTIVSEVITPYVLSTYRNIDGITLTALEGYAEYAHPFRWMGGDMTITPYLNWIYYLERHNEDDETASQYRTRTPFYIPDLSLTAGVASTWRERFALDLNAVHTGTQKIQGFETDAPSLDKDPFTILYASFRYAPTGLLALTFRVENLLDEDYEFVDGYPMPGRAVIAGLELRF